MSLFVGIILLAYLCLICCVVQNKDHVLTVFISITSGPNHAQLRDAARSTWLSRCNMAASCDYRFFIDTNNITTALIVENEINGDILFRNICPLMARHPDHIHYGNAQVEDDVPVHPDYLFRRLYKIDWKNCFMRWANATYGWDKLPLYHVYVEDDSYICTDNLLHQTSILSRMMYPNHSSLKYPIDLSSKYLPFRTGFPMGDGFDDSSTFMSKEIVQAFLQYYGTNGFDCSNIIMSNNPKVLSHAAYLSWGNSWRSVWCNWREVLDKVSHVKMNQPYPNYCMKAVEKHPYVQDVHLQKMNYTWKKHVIYSHDADLPCFDNPLIFHSALATESILNGPNSELNYTWHFCEYFLLIDKVKLPKEMYYLWNATYFQCRHPPHEEDSGLIHRHLKTSMVHMSNMSKPDSGMIGNVNQGLNWLVNQIRRSPAVDSVVPAKEHTVRKLHEHVMQTHRPICDASYTIETAMKDHVHIYHNLSAIFLHDTSKGMEMFIDEYLNHTHCNRYPNDANCASHRYFRKLTRL